MHSKILLFATLFFAISSVTWAKLQISIKPPAILELRKQAEACEKKTGVPADTFKKIVDWPFPNDRPSKEFFYCVCHNAGYLRNDGYMDVEMMSTLEVEKGTKEEYVNAIKECNKMISDDNVELGYSMGDCIHSSCTFTVVK